MSAADAGREVVEAVVWMGGVETPYRRGGDGAFVLLLLPATGVEHDGLFEALAADFRVIAPLRLPHDDGPPRKSGSGGPWEAWLRDLIDGLGLDRPPLVVDAALVKEVARCARVDPGRIRAVIPTGPAPDRLVAQLRTLLQND